MKKIVSIIATLFVLATTAQAAESSALDNWGVKTIIGIEGGFGQTSIETNATGATNQTPYLGGLGLKLGAEGQEYRIYIDGRYYIIDGVEFAFSGGATIQYIFRFSNFMNYFVGIEAGVTSFRYKVENESFTRETGLQLYYGANTGFNFDITDSVGIELGGRYMVMDAANTKDGVLTKIPYIAEGYLAIDFKYVME